MNMSEKYILNPDNYFFGKINRLIKRLEFDEIKYVLDIEYIYAEENIDSEEKQADMNCKSFSNMPKEMLGSMLKTSETPHCCTT